MSEFRLKRLSCGISCVLNPIDVLCGECGQVLYEKLESYIVHPNHGDICKYEIHTSEPPIPNSTVPQRMPNGEERASVLCCARGCGGPRAHLSTEPLIVRSNSNDEVHRPLFGRQFCILVGDERESHPSKTFNCNIMHSMPSKRGTKIPWEAVEPIRTDELDLDYRSICASYEAEHEIPPPDPEVTELQ